MSRRQGNGDYHGDSTVLSGSGWGFSYDSRDSGVRWVRRPMPKGPKGQKRPADVIGNAVKVMKIATGEEPEDYGPEKPAKDQAAAELGRKGGKARAEKMTPERRAEIATKAAKKRWGD